MITEINGYLSTLNRSPRTISTYRDALKHFVLAVGADAALTVDTYVAFLQKMRSDRLSPSTQHVYRTPVLGLYRFCKAGHRDELDEATRHYMKRVGYRLPVFDRDAIEEIVAYCDRLSGDLLALRDRAFVLLLADSGLRISEACNLKRGDVYWKEHKAVVIGKGDKQAVVNVSDRAMRAIKEYLRERSKLDGATGKPLATLPLFASHDKRSRKRLRSIHTGGMWAAIKARIEDAGIDRGAVRIHDFRHYAISTFYAATTDPKATQEYARHGRMETTSRYTHLDNGKLDRLFDEVFNRK